MSLDCVEALSTRRLNGYLDRVSSAGGGARCRQALHAQENALFGDIRIIVESGLSQAHSFQRPYHLHIL